MIQVAAVLFGVLAVAVAAFQVALVLGAPWGELTLGGRWRGPLPARVRAVPVVSALLLLLCAAVIAARAGLAFAAIGPYAAVGAWIVVGVCALGTLANAVTPSRRERALWLPVVSPMLALAAIVAIAGP